MIKILVFVVAAYLLYKLAIGDRKKKVENKKKEQEKMAANGTMVKDPICGTYVAADNEIRIRQGDTVHHFCSFDCRDKFLKQIEEESND
ncbi:MAG: transcriptional regulator [Desulfovibrionales bacterium]